MTDTTPEFSVVIPAFQAPGTVGSAIRSVLQQSERDLELIVIDDGSKDATAVVARQAIADDRRGRVIEQANEGVAGARNAGIREARGRFVSFLDNDDLWLPGYLTQMREALTRTSDTGMAYTDGYTLDDETRRIQVVSTMYNANPPEHTIEDRTELLLRLIAANFILSSVTVRRAVLLEVGGFDTSVTAVDDFDLWLRIIAAGYGARRTRDRMVIQRERADSQSKDPVVMTRAHLTTLTRLRDNQQAPAVVREEARRAALATTRQLEMLEGKRPLALVAHRSKLKLGRIRRHLLGATPTYDRPPAEIAAAFPDLEKI